MQYLAQCSVLAMSLAYFLASSRVFAKPAESDRVRKDPKLSGQEHYEGDGHNHNADYDHDAFLGEEDAKTFESLTPEESRERLGKIVERIDSNQDGYVTMEELKKHIEHQQKRYIYEDVDRQWKGHNQDGDEVLTWNEYNDTTYSSLSDVLPVVYIQHVSNLAHSSSIWKIRDYNRDGKLTIGEYIYMAYGVITPPEDEEELVKLEENERLDFRKMIRRDKNRWAVADRNRDGNLNIEEFTSFLHPEESAHMRNIVVEETLEDIDVDGDGFVSLEEYIGDMFKPESEGETEPSWVAQEREQFGLYRDRDGDGKMNAQEIGEWILPTEYDHAEAEAKHLMYEADVNKDNKLTKREILDEYDLFVGSQATDFGEALTRHDEF